MLSRFAVKSVASLRTGGVASVAQISKRTLSVSSKVFGDHHHAPTPIFVGPGAKDGKVPTDIEQAAGLERVELLADLEGREFFDLRPLDMTHLGTKKNPIVVESHDPIRYVGCTGFPVDSHETIWLNLESTHEFDRCPECGSVFKLKVVEQPDIPQGALLEHHTGEHGHSH